MQAYSQKARYYSFTKSHIIFLVLDTEITTPDITGNQLTLIQNVADTIEDLDYLVILHHRVLWMVDNPELNHIRHILEEVLQVSPH